MPAPPLHSVDTALNYHDTTAISRKAIRSRRVSDGTGVAWTNEDQAPRGGERVRGRDTEEIIVQLSDRISETSGGEGTAIKET